MERVNEYRNKRKGRCERLRKMQERKSQWEQEGEEGGEREWMVKENKIKRDGRGSYISIHDRNEGYGGK